MTVSKHPEPDSSLGRMLALITGLGLLGGAFYVGVLGGGSLVVATLLALLGAAALSGWVRARKSKK